MQKRAFIYCRVSSDEQKGNYSINKQIEACKKLALEKGFRIVKVYKDEGYSATVDNRPAFLEMINDCKKGEVDAIFVYHTDRWARNEYHHNLYRELVKEYDVILFSVTQPGIEKEEPEAKVLDGMMAIINAYYSRDLSRKTKRGMLGRWESGWWPGWAPIGYVNLDKEGKLSKKMYTPDLQRHFDGINRRLDPIEKHPVYNPLVVEGLNLYSTGNYSYLKLAKYLSKEGLRNRRGDPIGHTIVENMVKNSFYYGLMKWNGMKKMGEHKPSIDKKLFDLNQYIAAQHRQFLTRTRQHYFLLRGLIYCPVHMAKRKVKTRQGWKYIDDYRKLTATLRKNLNSKQRSQISYYHCGRPGGCKTSYIETEKLEKLVANRLKKMQFNGKFIELVKNKTKEILNQNNKNIRGQIKGLQNRRTALKRRQSKLLDLLIDGTISKQALKDKQSEIESQINELEGQIEDLESKSKIDYQLIEEIMSLTRNIHQTYLDAPDFLKKHYLRLFFERIYVKDEKIVKLVENPLFSTLRRQHQVLLRNHLLPG